MGPLFLLEVFTPKPLPFNMRSRNRILIPKTNSAKFGDHSLSFQASVIWNQLPNFYKNAASTKLLKQRIKQWNGTGCKCRICLY